MNRTRRQHPLPSHSPAVVAEFASRGITDLSRVFESNALFEWCTNMKPSCQLAAAYYTSDLEEAFDEPGREYHVYQEEDGKVRVRSYTYVGDNKRGKFQVFDGESVNDINETYFE